jgi:hypothetical protein
MRSVKAALFAMAWVAAWACSARAAYTDACNTFCSAPAWNASVDVGETFTFVLKGNVLSQLNLTGIQNDADLNPFLYVNKIFFGGSGTTSVTASLDSNGNTDVVFTGSNPVLPSYTFSYGAKPHFGLELGGATPTPPTVISSAWKVTDNMSNTTSSTQALPSLIAAPPTGTPTQFITVFANVTSGGQTTGTWLEVPYVAGQTPMLTNFTNQTETLSNVGFFLSPTQIPLDDLNFGTMPPPGSPGSTFTPIPGDDGMVLTPGDGMGGAGGAAPAFVPEPASVLSLALGLSLAAGWLRHRASRARRVC